MFSCDCLNVIVKNQENGELNGLKININSSAVYGQAVETVEFFKSAIGPFTGSVAIQHDALVQQIKLDNWTINRCLNCDSYVYANGEGIHDGKLLLNSDLARDQAQLITLMNCDKYSMPFKIVLKPISVLPNALQSITDDVRVKSLFDKLQNFIETDAKRMEAELRRLTMEMNLRRQKAETDFQQLVAIIESTNSTIESTTMSTDELTPPVTPESINDNKMMSMDSQLPHHKLMGKRDGNSKHSNAINQKRITKAIDFDDDIFEFDGMQDDSTSEATYHKYSDTEEGSDSENTTEKRPVNRGRSGSIHIARSAPISMPQFNHHVLHDIDTDDEKSNGNDQQMDIASSIQMLARSIHSDSVFGELPPRPVLRHNTEF